MNPYSEQIAKIDELWLEGQHDLAKSLVYQMPEFEAFVWFCRVRDLGFSQMPPAFRNNTATIFGSPAYSIFDAEAYSHTNCAGDNTFCYGRANMFWSCEYSLLGLILTPRRPVNYSRCSYRQSSTSEFYVSDD